MAVQDQLAQMLMFSPQTNADLMRIQQQQAMANALMEQGLTPLSTNDRQIGGVGYAISPMEGVAKLADALVGAYGQAKAIKGYEDLGNQMQGNGQASSASDSGNPFQDSSGNLTPLGRIELLNGNRAVAEYINPTPQQRNFGTGTPAFNQWVQTQVNPGGVKYQEGLGTNAAANAPVGTMPGPMGGQQVIPQGHIQPQSLPAVAPRIGTQNIPNPPTPSQIPQGAPPAPIPPVNASALTPPGISQNGMPQPNPGESYAAYQARLEAAKAGATAQAQMGPQILQAAAESGAKADFPEAQKIYQAGNEADNILTINNAIRELENGTYYSGQGGALKSDVANALASSGLGNVDLANKAARTEAIDALTKLSAFKGFSLAQAEGQGSGGIQIRNYQEFLAKMQQAANLDMMPGARDIALKFSDYQAKKVANNRDALNEFYNAGNPYINHNYSRLAAQKNASLELPVTEADINKAMGLPTSQNIPPVNVPVSKTINGVTYQKIGNQWFTQ